VSDRRRSPAAGLGRLFRRLAPRDRGELTLLLVSLGIVVLVLGFFVLAGEVLEGDTQAFDEHVLRMLRSPVDPGRPIGPAWLANGALDVTALGSPTVLGLAVFAISGFLFLQGKVRTGLFVLLASTGGWFVNAGLKQVFQRARPEVVPHLRDVVSLSFPSGHAMTSAVVYLTLGVVTMRVANRPLTKFYCMAVAMALSFLVGATRVYLGVHYPTDVLAGWLVGLSWALICWTVQHVLERRAGLARERQH
jgi:undecaprenyl-diphosphatase